MSTAKTIIISAPKYISAEPAFEVALSPRTTTILRTNDRKTSQIKKAFQCVSTMEKIIYPPFVGIESPPPTPSRKRRLDHLSLDEKIQRKKLKNRIAAQSSRDRKKAKMDDLESEVNVLKEQNKSLAERCQKLEAASQRLSAENEHLREQLRQARVGCAPIAASGPAESALIPPQKGRGVQPAPGLALLTLLLMALCHSCPTSQTSTATRFSPSWRSLLTHSSRKLLSCLPTDRHRALEKILKERAALKWWGHHQKMWNPVEMC